MYIYIYVNIYMYTYIHKYIYMYMALSLSRVSREARVVASCVYAAHLSTGTLPRL